MAVGAGDTRARNNSSSTGAGSRSSSKGRHKSRSRSRSKSSERILLTDSNYDTAEISGGSPFVFITHTAILGYHQIITLLHDDNTIGHNIGYNRVYCQVATLENIRLRAGCLWER